MSASDTDSDRPETFTLAQSKKAARQRNDEIEHAHAALRKKVREKNQKKDRLLKELAERRKEGEREKEGGEEEEAGKDVLSTETRMERAMREAQEEEEDEDEDEGREGSEGGEEWKGFVGEEDSDSEMGEDERSRLQYDEEMDGVSSESDNHQAINYVHSDESTEDQSEKYLTKKESASHLPEHIFKAAFASQKGRREAAPGKSRLQTTAVVTSSDHETQKKKKRKTGTSAKDIVVGSKTIRTLSTSLQTSKPGAYAPTRKAQRYRNRALAFNKGGNSAAVRGWQRRPANVGVLRSSGPAANFVRS